MYIYKNSSGYLYLFFFFASSFFTNISVSLAEWCTFSCFVLLFFSSLREDVGGFLMSNCSLFIIGQFRMLMRLTSTLPCSSFRTILLCVPVALRVHVCMCVRICKCVTLEAQLLNAPLTPWWTPLLQIKIKTRRGGGQMRRTKFFCVWVRMCAPTGRGCLRDYYRDGCVSTCMNAL